eukprot:11858107-Ditylum_brightwellii.AAC.1
MDVEYHSACGVAQDSIRVCAAILQKMHHIHSNVYCWVSLSCRNCIDCHGHGWVDHSGVLECIVVVWRIWAQQIGAVNVLVVWGEDVDTC